MTHMDRRIPIALSALAFALVVGCGGETSIPRRVRGGTEQPGDAGLEACNGLDDDRDGVVDEGFRDAEGRYVADDACGGCGLPCGSPSPGENGLTCRILEGEPRCVATRCWGGYAENAIGRCVPAFQTLCLPCVDDADCGDVVGARCLDVGGESRCAEPCGAGCPLGYVCGADEVCVPSGGSCECGPTDSFGVACALRDPMGALCAGSATCDHGVLSPCAAPPEVCDEQDNDCDGTVDETYRDAFGAYSVDIHNCGACGVDCTASPIPQGDLICGGDPLSPSCVLSCPDALDGLQPGDRIDADRDIATGCECTLSALDDVPGPVGAVGAALDVNCDGADGVVTRSFYVATDGDDAAIGSPTRPLKTLREALRRASESRGTATPRTHVYVASGSYTESLSLPDGIEIHGGYRRDFLALDPAGFLVEVRAPVDTTTAGGAALLANGAGTTRTVVEWLVLRGRDAIASSEATFGAVLVDPGAQLVLRELEIRAGVPGPGVNGARGASGTAPSADPTVGAPPRAALEDSMHRCVAGDSNLVAGGSGGRNQCAGVDVGGGNGGSPHCPTFAAFEPSGANGAAPPSRIGGAGGAGGQDSSGPVTGTACRTGSVCCGLADFTVPTDFAGPQPGQNGVNGALGGSGTGCVDPLGSFLAGVWTPATASAGTPGGAGSGGGGGGAGGGVEYAYYPGVCAYPDGLGGGGGGGGAGGCGGSGGTAGTTGGPSVALVVSYASVSATLPTIVNVRLRPSDGARGGDGGPGGEGGRGGTGALGGEIPRSERTTPPLAGPFPGARGGRGGDGGYGGSGGGGCGGSSVGIWLTGVGTAEPPGASGWRSGNAFVLGVGGAAGRGGGTAGANGTGGGAFDVVVR